MQANYNSWTTRGNHPTLNGRTLIPAGVGNNLLESGLRVAKGGGELYVYAGGVYVPGEMALRELLARDLEDTWQSEGVKSVITWLYDFAQPLWERPPLDRINFENGILNLNNFQLEPHRPEFRSAVRIPLTYDPAAECPA